MDDSTDRSSALGWFDLSLNVADLDRSKAFYQDLGLSVAASDHEERWALLTYGNLRLALYEGHIEGNMLTFRGADVSTIAAELADRGHALGGGPDTEPDGSTGAWIVDPDGNMIYFNSEPEGEPPDGWA